MHLPFADISYRSQSKCVSWSGLVFRNGSALSKFMEEFVAARFHDKPQKQDFKRLLCGLELTNMGQSSLETVLLAAEETEELDWAIGESLAESLLIHTHAIVFPWNMKRDLRNPKASLPGADIVGLMPSERGHCLVLGEVKSSSESRYPPQVMFGRSGMTHQIDKLANDLTVVYQLLLWLFARVKQTEYQTAFEESLQNYLDSGNKAIKLFGILVRDTNPNELDLKRRGIKLDGSLAYPTSCELIAVYLCCPISELPKQIKGGGKP